MQVNESIRRQSLSGWRKTAAVACLLPALCLCSCKARQAQKTDPFLSEPNVSASDSDKRADRFALEPGKRRPSAARTADASRRKNRTAEALPVKRDAEIKFPEFPTTAQSAASDSNINVASFAEAESSRQKQPGEQDKAEISSTGQPEISTDDAVISSPFDPRVPLTPAGHDEENRNGGERSPFAAASEHADEYLHDGGDREPPGQYDGAGRIGIETEDTFAAYTDEGGRRHMKASNRISIYSPRFGAVRSYTSPSSGVAVDQLAEALESQRTSGLRNRTVPSDQTQQEGMDALRVRSRASGAQTEAGIDGLAQRFSPAQNVKLDNPYEDLAFLQSGRFRSAERARIDFGVKAALVWSDADSPVISAGTAGGQEVSARFSAQEVVGVEDQRKTEGDLRILKLADRMVAHPGDVVTFSIRYDNVGQRELLEVRIVDNLTPRLEYIEESASSDRAARLVVEENMQGSHILRFELTEPLPGGEGGAVTFQVRVR